ncbi:hypothetical protein HaLaN_07336 [Haematococcus lacustris]|uniref:Uncharacterized protein n=1 Tax=Haematococcus lacustris TaxID=44745 RepID=A0A699YP86_HAELA|nr:hypothetical protein HaLaN_07336 [Haematococcus lacustris]
MTRVALSPAAGGSTWPIRERCSLALRRRRSQLTSTDLLVVGLEGLVEGAELVARSQWCPTAAP